MVYGESDESVLDKPELDVYILTCCPTCAPDQQPSLWIRVVQPLFYCIFPLSLFRKTPTLVLSGWDLVCFFKWFLCGLERRGGLTVAAKKDQCDYFIL